MMKKRTIDAAKTPSREEGSNICAKFAKTPRAPRKKELNSLLGALGELGVLARRFFLRALAPSWWLIFLLLLCIPVFPGCGAGETQDKTFFTSGSREADQRAQQRIAKTQQLRGKSEKGAGDEATKKDLYSRLGGDKGLAMIVDDFVNRSMADPRVNWTRKNVKRASFGFHKGESIERKLSDGDVVKMKTHILQFLAVATGGPTIYTGRDMKEAHKGLQISNAEFDASVGDLKATLDKLAVPTDDQKELLALVESTRPQVVEEK